MLFPVVTLKTPRNSRHPWIFKKMIQPPRVMLEPGSLVEVRDKGGAFVAYAFFHPENTIALRVLSENRAEAPDGDFFRNRLEIAKKLRESVLDPELFAGPRGASGASYRLVHAEADGLPGLVVDKFADILLIEPYVSGWLHLADLLVAALKELYPGATPVFRADPGAAAKEGVSFAKAERKYPAPAATEISEYGLRYRVDFRTGHKTGFFLDQRDNRRRAARLARGRKVLDLCCYSGGFALSAWQGGAAAVEAVDLDEQALEMAAANLALNGAENDITLTHADAFDLLRDRSGKKTRYGLVVLDPPKLAAGQDDVEAALKRYYDLNRAALGVVESGGYFVTCSCSGAVPEERWRQTVRKAAADAGRGLVIFEAAGPGCDHPVAGDFPQGRYLKALFSRVD